MRKREKERERERKLRRERPLIRRTQLWRTEWRRTSEKSRALAHQKEAVDDHVHLERGAVPADVAAVPEGQLQRHHHKRVEEQRSRYHHDPCHRPAMITNPFRVFNASSSSMRPKRAAWRQPFGSSMKPARPQATCAHSPELGSARPQHSGASRTLSATQNALASSESAHARTHPSLRTEKCQCLRLNLLLGHHCAVSHSAEQCVSRRRRSASGGEDGGMDVGQGGRRNERRERRMEGRE